jgi:hypothetical protein
MEASLIALRILLLGRAGQHPRARPSCAEDHARANARRRQAGRDYHEISIRLPVILGGNVSKLSLLKLARQIAKLKGIKLDRDAQRLKECLICWFCENCKDEIMRYAPPSPPPPPISQGLPPAHPIPEEFWDRLEREFQPMAFSLFDFE